MSRSDKNPASKIFVGRMKRLAAGPALQCLIVSSGDDRRQLLSRAVSSTQWQPIVAADVEQAAALLRVRLMQLAIVDIEGEDFDSYSELLETLSQTSGLLLVVCGNQAAIDEECFLRQLGAWMYLPGLADAACVPLLCEEAKPIVERLARQTAEAISGRVVPQGSTRPALTRAHGRHVS